MKIAFFGALPPRAQPIADQGEALLAALAKHGDVGVFVDGYVPQSGSIGSSCRVHDLEAEHYRNVLCEYDVIVYQLADVSACGFLHAALCEWPGVVVIHDDDPEPLFRREPCLRRAVCERSLARVVYSPRLAERLRDDNPWIPVFVVEHPGGACEIAAAVDAAIAGQSSPRGGHWLRTLLETACAELPGFVPADRSAPWRAELDELAGLLESEPAGEQTRSFRQVGEIRRKGG